MRWWPFRKRVEILYAPDPFSSYVAILEVPVLPHALHGADGSRISKWPHYVLTRKDTGRQVELTEGSATLLLGGKPQPWMRYELEIHRHRQESVSARIIGTDQLKDPDAPPPPEPEVLTLD